MALICTVSTLYTFNSVVAAPFVNSSSTTEPNATSTLLLFEQVGITWDGEGEALAPPKYIFIWVKSVLGLFSTS